MLLCYHQPRSLAKEEKQFRILPSRDGRARIFVIDTIGPDGGELNTEMLASSSDGYKME